ncbi:MAG: xanthine dehydrogenase molybdopterin binding subunit [Hahellaceae bacterium]|jgi:xanthine dehydrogenase large subunit|nr:xanthine dehydrogenase molybdopterin binding subunit [Hahellaceae bacterium]
MRRLSSKTAKTVREPNRQGGVGANVAHDSAVSHVTGRALYVDDLPLLPGLLHLAVGGSPLPHGRLRALDLDAVRSAPGVVRVLTCQDIPGHRDVGPVFPGDPLLVEDRFESVGQALFAVVATSYEAAHRALKQAQIDIDPLPAILDIETALAQQAFVRPSHQQLRGNPDAAIEGATHQLEGEVKVLGQEHFYLEGQVSQANPQEDGGMMIYASTQHPSEVQKLVAEMLALPIHRVQVETRRLGGGFGGKETQAAPVACLAALAAHLTGRPVRYRMSRRDDMIMTGKRHAFLNRWRVGFNAQGVIQGTDITLAAKCGLSPDLSDAIVDRAMFHAGNAYYLGEARVTGHRCKTHTVSNTAFRGFGGPQGMLAAEDMIEHIARHLGEDTLTIRMRNLYTPGGRQTTHYGQTVEDFVLRDLMNRLQDSADYWARREACHTYNQQGGLFRKGLAMTPVMFGISFTAKHLNQAGALVHIYTDGSIHLNHGGTEMGQGLFIKVAQVVAEAFQVDLARVAVSATRTDKVPNTSATAASAGSDLNGMAALNACQTLKLRLIEFACQHFSVTPDEVAFESNHVRVGADRFPFADFVQLAYLNRISLSATGFYQTPFIGYDREKGQGHPFFYYAHGAAVSEVLVDTMTGEYRVLRTDILHDVGDSLNPAIDIGQIEGGFVQGLGWLTTEELRWDERGHLMADSPATYKIPTLGDIPTDFRVAILQDAPNREPTIYRSKAVGEPPFMLAFSVWAALRDAIASLTDYRYSPPLHPPATPERVWQALDAARRWKP